LLVSGGLQVAADFGAYYYLSFIGTAPEARGKGYGSLLLRCITDRADREGRWCLLEATSERSQVRHAGKGVT
jgi:ribosomal protein S18 acetylase RimI-like enzyme